VWREGRLCDEPVDGVVELGMEHGLLQQADVYAGQDIWQTDDPQLTRRLRRTFTGDRPLRRVPIDVDIHVEPEQPIELTVHCEGRSWVVPSDYLPQAAVQHPLTDELVQQQLGRLGQTVYQLRTLNARIVNRPMVPLSIWGGLRHRMVEILEARMYQRSRRVAPAAVLPDLLRSVGAGVGLEPAAGAPSVEPVPQLRVLCRSVTQLEAALAAGCRQLIADFHDVRQYREAVSRVHRQGGSLELATLRICKPGEEGLLKALARQGADGWLVRHLTAAQFAIKHQIPFATDFSLNITNPLSAQWWHSRGARRITASYDLNREQLLELAQGMPAQWLEVVIHQHMPMFHMEHCVFCSVLSPGTNKTNCGRPCDRHQVQLRDRVGALHVLQADIGCRNTLYNATPQSGAEAVGSLRKLGVLNYRIELLQDLPPDAVAQLVGLYRELLAGARSAASVWKQLQADNRVGVTRGTMEQPRNPLAII
jgi:putative protease